jgi:L-lactate dehydrogenase complex protein LldG
MNTQETILGRIRDALRLPRTHAHKGHSPVHAATPEEFRPWLPQAGDTPADWLRSFLDRSAELKTEVAVLEDESLLPAALCRLATAGKWKKIAIQGDPLTRQAAASVNLPFIETARGYETAELEACDAGLSLCEALVAQTGSILVTSRHSGGRALSVLPPHHIVLARKNQLLPDLAAAFRQLRETHAPDYPSMISFITGPSRTGDIERILVLGAHGPKKLTVFILP